jgi:hypothetical protein
MGDSCENVPQMLPFHRQLGDLAQAQDFLSPYMEQPVSASQAQHRRFLDAVRNLFRLIDFPCCQTAEAGFSLRPQQAEMPLQKAS